MDLDSGLFQRAPTGWETFLVWYGNHWILGTILVLTAAWIAVTPFKIVAGVFLRKMRSNDIRSQGWPPAHLNADGDYRVEEADG
jgi:hypothetical protein